MEDQARFFWLRLGWLILANRRQIVRRLLLECATGAGERTRCGVSGLSVRRASDSTSDCARRIEMTSYFTVDKWAPPFYELVIRFLGRSDRQLESALNAVWSYPELRGPYRDDSEEPENQETVSAAEGIPIGDSAVHLYGLAVLPTGGVVACGTVCHVSEASADELTFYLPYGALESIYGLSLPPDVTWLTWTNPIDEWLAQIARAVYDSVGFDFAVMGAEGETDLGLAYAARQAIRDRTVAMMVPSNSGEISFYPRP